MNMINWNRLTPAVYAIYEAGGERGTTSDAANKVQRNVIDGADTCPGADALPPEFRPDWPALGGLEAVQEGNDTFNTWLRKLKAIDRELYSLYQARDFQGMVEAVVNLPDPGPDDNGADE